MPEAAESEATPGRACHECGARQDECQEICVECGAAVPRERKGLARLKSVSRPVALAGFAVLIVTSAAYGITANADRGDSAVKQAVAAAPPQPTATTPAPTPPPATTPAPAPAPAPPAETSPAPAPPKPAKPSTPAPKPAPSPPAPSPSPSPAPSTSPTPHHENDNTHARPRTPRHHSHEASWLSEGDQPYSATLFDPYANGIDEHASLAPKAVDDKASTSWISGVHPNGDLGKAGVGLVIEAGGYQSYSALGIQTTTPGFAATIYSTDASDPPTAAPDQPGSGWKREAAKTDIAKQQRLPLKGATANPHYVLVWITKLPAGKTRAALSELSLLP